MKKYILRLVTNHSEETKKQLNQIGANVVFSDSILANLVIVETESTLTELQAHPLVSSVEEERVFSLNI